jgi:hypothetical protein
MISDVQELLDKYTQWLKDKTFVKEIGDYIEITTPYLDRHNDYIQIYARREDRGFLLTDDGYTINDLEISGCKIDTPKRKQLLALTLNGFGVQINDKVLQVHATVENFAIKKHNIVQAILAVNDMFYLAEPMVASIFYEDVVLWMDSNEIRYTPRVKFTGRTGFDHSFDFVIPKSKDRPERVIQTITRPSKDSASSLAFAWVDTREVRPIDSRFYAFLNDQEQGVPVDVIDALKNYEINPIVWSRRDDYRIEFAS